MRDEAGPRARKVRRLRRLSIGVALLAACGMAAGQTIATAGEAMSPADPPPYPMAEGRIARDVTIPIGEGVGEVGVDDGDGAAWGPSSFIRTGEGAFVVADGVNRKLLFTSASGEAREVRYPDRIVSPVDMARVGGHFLLLDLPAQPQSLHLMTPEGELLESWPIPEPLLEHGVSGIGRVSGPANALSVDLEAGGSWEVPFLRGGRPAPLQRPDLQKRNERLFAPPDQGGRFGLSGRGEARHLAFIADDGSGATITSHRGECEDERVRIPASPGALVEGARPLGRDRSARLHVLLMETTAGGLDASLATIEPGTGAVRTRLTLPLSEFEVWPEQWIRLDDDGSVHVMAVGKTEVVIGRLLPEVGRGTSSEGDTSTEGVSESRSPENPHLDRVAEAKRRGAGSWPFIRALREWASEATRLSRPREAFAAWTRLNGNDRAWSYIGNRWYCNKASYYKSCKDGKYGERNVRPRFISYYGKTYSSVPYCWGGWDTVPGFNDDMSADRAPGDINTSPRDRPKAWCTSGVDCSGFVSRCFGLGKKYSTSTLYGVTRGISRSSMRGGDVYLKRGHVMYFLYHTSSGSQVLESTVYNAYDRVVNNHRPYTVLAYYEPRRYVNW